MITSIFSILVVGLATVNTAVAAQQCSKYTVDTTEKTYAFNHYSFIDFRNKTNNLDSYLQSDEFANAYRISTWTKQPSGDFYGFQNTAANVKMGDNDAAPGQSMLSLTVARGQDGAVTAGELESTISDYYYASVRMGVRVTGAVGACAGLFFYHSDTQETDIEILTQEQANHKDAETQEPAGPTTAQLHFTNQPRVTKTVDLSVLNNTNSGINPQMVNAKGSWEVFNNYRIDWVPGRTYWWQNGEMSHSETKNMIQNPSAWLFNLWSNGDPTWSGILAPGSKARMDIAWVEIAYNRLDEGAPEAVSIGQDGTCKLGLGDGTNLEDPSVEAGPAGLSSENSETNATNQSSSADASTSATAGESIPTTTSQVSTSTEAPPAGVTVETIYLTVTEDPVATVTMAPRQFKA